jgi:transcriptional regulator with XRE-family HTH domain
MDDKEIKSVQREFGLRLRALREEKGITQEQLAGDSGLDRSYVNTVENGGRNLSLIAIHKLAQALKVAARDLMG